MADTTGADAESPVDREEMVYPSLRIPDAVYQEFQQFVEERAPAGSMTQEASRAVVRDFRPTPEDEQLEEIWESAVQLFGDPSEATHPGTGAPVEWDEDVPHNRQRESTGAVRWHRMDDDAYRKTEKTQLKLAIPRWARQDLIGEARKRFGSEYYQGRVLAIILSKWMARRDLFADAADLLRPQAEATTEVADEEVTDPMEIDPVDPEEVNPFEVAKGPAENGRLLIGVLRFESDDARAWTKRDLYDRAYELWDADEDHGRTRQTCRNYAQEAMELMESTKCIVETFEDDLEGRVERKAEGAVNSESVRERYKKPSDWWSVSGTAANIMDEPRWTMSEERLVQWITKQLRHLTVNGKTATIMKKVIRQSVDMSTLTTPAGPDTDTQLREVIEGQLG